MPQAIVVVPWLAFLFIVLFAFGCAVGSFLNVVVARLPAGMSLYKPPSRCGACLTPIARRDNLPLISYWRLKGRCRACGAPFSMRYFWAELLTGLGFVAIYLFDVVLDLQDHYYPFGGYWYLSWGIFPPGSWVIWAYHAIFLSLLIVAATCAGDNGKAPRSVLALGAAIGIAGATLLPWPWPARSQEAAQMIPRSAWPAGVSRTRPEIFAGGEPWTGSLVPRSGVYVLPVWGPLPEELPAADWRLGLVTGLAGLLAGGLLARSLLLPCQRNPGTFRFGDGEGDYLAVAGAFLGWQQVVIAALLAFVPALFLAWLPRRSAGPPRYPLGRVLMISLLVTWFGWPFVASYLQPLLFNRDVVLGAAAVLALLVPAGFLRKSVHQPAPVIGAASVPAPPEHAPTPVPSTGDSSLTSADGPIN